MKKKKKITLVLESRTLSVESQHDEQVPLAVGTNGWVADGPGLLSASC